jgi:hypothetical protein
MNFDYLTSFLPSRSFLFLALASLQVLNTNPSCNKTKTINTNLSVTKSTKHTFGVVEVALKISLLELITCNKPRFGHRGTPTKVERVGESA